MRAKYVNEKFRETTDPIKDMGIGIVGLWDYTLKDAVDEIWAVMKETIYKQISHAKRNRATFIILPLQVAPLAFLF